MASGWHTHIGSSPEAAMLDIPTLDTWGASVENCNV